MDFLKEAARIILIGIVSYLLTEGVLTPLVEAVTLNFNVDPLLKTQITMVIGLVLKSLDRWLHESGNAEKGLTRF